jgi:1,4-dihydroxy-2-naphthoate octaprenyltransferase
MSKVKHWISAFRLRTLPLAFSCILMGSFTAWFQDAFSWEVLALALLTTLFLQVLSNLANDYGDFKSGADSELRQGPQRMVQSGNISALAMKQMMVLFGFLSFLSGTVLLHVAFEGHLHTSFLVFLLLGVLAIAAAIKYTVGKRPYGYRALGDWYVFVFFGLVGVIGTYYLHAHTFHWMIVGPAMAVGMLSTGVLNVNNMRDEQNDRSSGKRTLVVLMGGRFARLYHLGLLLGAFVCLILFTMLDYRSPWQFLFLLSVPVLFQHIRVVWRNNDHAVIDPELKKLALTTFFTVLLFGVGLLLAGY